MTAPIVECVPNFSEARRPEVVEAIMQAVSSVPGVSLLDRHSDLDHNRTVLTFVGSPQDVEEAAYRAIAKAAELIDLNQHTGAHPRIGATDVVPFVPISGVTMQDCVDLARRLGQRVGEKLGIPVYLYEEAATRPERRNLENIRRGQYEALRDEIAAVPERAPDFGPLNVGPAGATVIGARQFLIAFNVYLNSSEIEIAKKIARTLRYSSGGLRYVKALGLLVDGRAQVSMNLTNFHGTPLAQVVEMVRREAARYGTSVHHSELVGLIPQEALVDAAVWYLQMDQFEPEQVLEQRMAAALHGSDQQAEAAPGHEIYPFLDELAAGTAAPGGGSASAYSAAAGAALTVMVARLTVGKKKYAAVEDQMQAVIERAEDLRLRLTEAIARDAAAFETVIVAYKLPKETLAQQDERSRAIESSLLVAAQVPLEVAGMALEVLELNAQVVAYGNLNAASDGATGAALTRAGLVGAGYNVRANVKLLQDRVAAQELLSKLNNIEQRAEELERRIRSNLIERGGLPLG